MTESSQDENITLYTYAEIEEVKGFVGNYEVTIRKKARSVDLAKCTGCGTCNEKCPVVTGNEFDLNMAPRKAIYIPFPQAVPGKYTIDMDHCIKCGICARPDVCECGAVNYNDKDKLVTLDVGTIIVSTGYDPIDATYLKNYGYGKYDNVVDGLQFERLLSSTGPVLGKPVRPSDGKAPHSVLWVQCAGSRDTREGCKPYCSRVCCLYAIKQARQYKEKHPEADVYITYMDIRAFGKGYEEFYDSAQRNFGIKFIRGRMAELNELPDKQILVRMEDTLLGKIVEMKLDLVVLSVGLTSKADAGEMAAKLSIQRTGDGFFMEAHPKLRPVDCLTDGIFVAGVAQGPKDIPDAVAQAKGASSSAAILMAQGEVEVEPYFSIVDEALCAGCRSCITLCPYGAISFDETKKVAIINSVKCKGCGTCAAACPSCAIYQNHFQDDQLESEIHAALPLPDEVKNGGCD